jgi:hypothetical protein
MAPMKVGIWFKMPLPIGQYAEKLRYTSMFPFDVADDAICFLLGSFGLLIGRKEFSLGSKTSPGP